MDLNFAIIALPYLNVGIIHVSIQIQRSIYNVSFFVSLKLSLKIIKLLGITVSSIIIISLTKLFFQCNYYGFRRYYDLFTSVK